MSKELQEELDEIEREAQESESKKKNVTFSIDPQVLTTFKGMLRNRRMMSRTVEALIRDYIRTRQASVLDFGQQSDQKKG